jgi:hypothetical protein
VVFGLLCLDKNKRSWNSTTDEKLTFSKLVQILYVSYWARLNHNVIFFLQKIYIKKTCQIRLIPIVQNIIYWTFLRYTHLNYATNTTTFFNFKVTTVVNFHICVLSSHFSVSMYISSSWTAWYIFLFKKKKLWCIDRTVHYNCI